MQRTTRMCAYLWLVLIGLAILLPARMAHAATIPVNTPADGIATDGNCTLREAVQAANTDAAVDACPAGAGADTITLPSGTYTLTLPGFDDVNGVGDLDIASSLTIAGFGSANTIIRQSVSDRVLTVASGSVNLSGLSISGGSVSANGGGMLINAGATVSLMDVAVSDNQVIGGASSGGGIANNGVLTISNGLFYSNTAVNGGGLYSAAPAWLSNTAFLSNTATNNGGGVSANQPLTVLGGEFSNNQASWGGGVYDNFGSPGVVAIVISGTQFISNSSLNSGGAIYLLGGDAVLTGGVFDRNRSIDAGGAILVGNLTLTDTVFVSNTAGNTGGALYAAGAITLTGGQFNRNQVANGSGGAIRVIGPARMAGTQFINNSTAGFYGGAVYADAQVWLTSTVFLSSTANNNGGAVYVVGAAQMRDGLFQNNISTIGSGGGLYAVGPAWLTHTTFLTNTANTGGGVANGFGSALVVTGTVFLGNAALAEGGAVLINNGALTATQTIFLGNTAGTSGGAVYSTGTGRANLVNALFTRNASPEGAAMYLNGSNGASVQHVTIADVTPNPNEAMVIVQGNVFITNTIFANHATGIDRRGGAASDTRNLFFNITTRINGAVVSDGGIIGNPDFVAPASDNFHLGGASQAVDVGLPSGVLDDIDGDPRPYGAGVEIGFDERLELPITGLSLQSNSPNLLGATTLMTASVTTGDNVLCAWDFGDGVTQVAPLTQTVAHTYTLAGVYTVTVIATNTVSSASVTLPVTLTNLTPVAVAGPDQATTVSATVTMDGSASSDPDGHTPLAYGWAQTGGPNVSLSNANTAAPTFIAPAAPATLTFALIVTDAFGLASAASDEVSIGVNDIPITGLATQSSSPTRLSDVTALTATVATGSNVGYTWNFGDGSLISNTTTTATHAYTLAGVYSVMVTATNGAGSASASTQVTVTNFAPNANAGLDFVASVSATVTLNGSASSDPDGHTPLAYRWVQTGGFSVTLNNANTAAPTFIAPAAPATLTFALIVTDAFGLADATPDEVRVLMRDIAISGLTAQSSSANGPIRLGNPVTLTAAIATGSNVVYVWDFGDGSLTHKNVVEAVANTAVHIYGQAGVFTITVTATNGAGSASATKQVTVTNLAPNANAGPDQTVGTNTTATLNGSASSDPDAHALQYRWTQTGGPAVALSNATSAQTSFTTPGGDTTLSFALAVTDSYGLGDATPDTVIVNVNALAPSGLTVTAGPNNTRHARLRDAMMFAASVSSGSDVAYTWNFGDGSAVASGITATHVYAARGVFTAVVTATNAVGSASQTLTVTVSNLEPFAIAGPDQTVSAGAMVTLDAGSSIDQDGHTPLTFQWTQKSGAGVSLSNATTARPSFTAPSGAATLVFGVRVIDSVGLISSGQDEVVITINAAPAISFGAGQAQTAANVQPSASSLVAAQPQPAPVPTVRVTEVGTAAVPRATAVSVSPIAPQPTPIPPIREVRITGLRTTQAVVLDGTMRFTASLQRGSNVVFAWDFGDGEMGSGASVEHRYAALGRYQVVMTATNNFGRVVTNMRVVVATLPPTATPTPTSTPEPTATPLLPSPTPTLPAPNVSVDGNTSDIPPGGPTLPAGQPVEGNTGVAIAESVLAGGQPVWLVSLPSTQIADNPEVARRQTKAIVRATVAHKHRQVGVFILSLVAIFHIARMVWKTPRSRRARRITS